MYTYKIKRVSGEPGTFRITRENIYGAISEVLRIHGVTVNEMRDMQWSTDGRQCFVYTRRVSFIVSRERRRVRYLKAINNRLRRLPLWPL